MNRMTKKTALITGAAGDIGSEVARRLNKQGYRLLLVDIDKQALETLAAECSDAETIELNLTNRDDLAKFIESINKDYRHINVAFINAGVIKVGNILDVDAEKIDMQLELNLRSAIQLIRGCAQNMAQYGSGHIISTISMGGIISLKGSATYSASKFGLRGFMIGIRDELKPLGIDVSGILPSGVDTKMLRYEAQNGGSPLNFLATPQTVEQVGDAFMQALKSKRLEYYVPYSDSITGRLINTLPWSVRHIYPVLERMGERGRAKYLKYLKDNNHI